MKADRHHIILLVVILTAVALLSRQRTKKPTDPVTPPTSRTPNRWSVDEIWLGMTSRELEERHRVTVTGERSVEVEIAGKLVSVKFSRQGEVSQVIGFSTSGLRAGSAFDEMLKALGPPTASEYFSTPNPVVAVCYPAELRVVYYPDKEGNLGQIPDFLAWSIEPKYGSVPRGICALAERSAVTAPGDLQIMAK